MEKNKKGNVWDKKFSGTVIGKGGIKALSENAVEVKMDLEPFSVWVDPPYCPEDLEIGDRVKWLPYKDKMIKVEKEGK